MTSRALITALLCSVLAAPAAAGGSAFPGLAVQLYSVRDDLAADFTGTLEALARMGFEAVEFAGNYGPYENDPAGLRAYLASIGLKTAGAHVRFEHFSEANFDATVTFFKALDCDLLIVPWDERAWSPDGVEAVVADLNAAAAKLAPHGLRTGWHNHDREFEPFRDSTFWDFIADNTGPEVVLQQDVGWTRNAGKDAAEYVHRHPGRTVTTHYKSLFPKGESGTPIIGRDDFDWPRLIRANLEAGGTRWLVLEQEKYPDGMSPLDAVAASKRGLDGYLAAFRD